MADATVIDVLDETLAPGAAGRTSPAAHLTAAFAAAEVTGPRGVALREVPFLTMVGIRVRPGSPAAARLEERLGTSLPAACGEVSTGQRCDVVWLSPDEFLAVGAEPPAALTSALL